MTPHRRSMMWMVVLAAVWVVVERTATTLERPYTLYQVVWMRYAAHLLFMLAVWGWRDPRALLETRRPVFQFARSLLMVSMPVAVILALSRGADGDAFFAVFWVAPLLVLAIAHVVLGERASAATWIAAGAAAIGALVALGHRLTLSPMLIGLALVSSASFCTYIVMTRMLRQERLRANLFYTALGVFLVMSPLMPRVWIMPTPRDLVVFFAIGLLGLVVLVALDRSASLSPVSVSAPVAAVQAAFTVGERVLLSGHLPDVRGVIGVACIGAVAGWTWMRSQRVGEPSARLSEAAAG